MTHVHATSTPSRQPVRSEVARGAEGVRAGWPAYAAFLLSCAFAWALIFGVVP